MTFAQFLLSLVGPLASRALVYLGIGLLTVTGIDSAVNGMISVMQGYWNGLPVTVLQLASLAKVPEGLGIVVGSQVAKVLLWLKLKATRFAYKGAS